jgi:hypothetical protein
VRAKLRTSCSLLLAAATCLGASLFGTARAQQTQIAQIGSYGGQAGPQMEAPPTPGAPEGNPLTPPPSAEHALIAGNWLLYPTALAAFLYDTNPNQVATGAQASPGLRLVPSITAERTSGDSKTDLYGMIDTELYTNQSSADAVAARLGATEDYQPAPDWLLHARVDYTRQKDLFSTFGTSPTGQLVVPLNPTAVGLEPVANPETYNQLSAEAAAEKRFGNAFIQFGGSVVDIRYENTGAVAPSPNGNVYTGIGRGGFWLTPDFYGYLEVDGDSRDYVTGSLSSSGYRVVAGIGSHQIGLFQGQIFAGYQAENYDSSGIGTVGTPAFGGILHYYPLPELTVDVGVNRTLGVSLLATTPTSPAGTATELTDFLADAAYALAPEWTASAHLGYIHTNYIDSVRVDDAWTIEPTLTYSVWRNFGVTLDYQYLRLVSTVPLQGYSRSVITIGVSYKY